MTTFTQWFNIKKDGQPRKPGWWDARYFGQQTSGSFRFWWDGKVWRQKPKGGETAFGNSVIFDDGDCYRGLAVKPKSGISSK